MKANPDGSTITHGVTDLMTSLAVIFILLFASYVTKVSETESRASEPAQPRMRQATEDIRGLLRDHFQRYDLSLDADATDPNVLRIVVPEALLNFEFGKGVLSRAAERFLTDAMPAYAQLLCGSLGANVASLVIEGHTDDLGTDIHNLKLSQERSLNVMVKGLEVIQQSSPWAYGCFHEKTSASGRGRQDLIYDEPNVPNRDKSRRVVFKLRLHAEGQTPQS